MKQIPVLLVATALVFAGETYIGDQVDVQVVAVDDGFDVIGMEYTGDNPEDVVTLWEEFVQRIPEIQGEESEDIAYGVLLDYNALNGEFTYMAAVMAYEQGPPPEGMRSLTIPGGDYAVFTFPFSLLGHVYEFVYSEWLPQSQYTHGEGYDFEYYPAEFETTEEGVMMKLYVSVVESE